jgi:hypothetical protein
MNDTRRKRLRCASETNLRNSSVFYSAVRCLIFEVSHEVSDGTQIQNSHQCGFGFGH